MTVTITQDDIDRGIRWQSTKDPVALAMCRALAIEVWGSYAPATFGTGHHKHPPILNTGKRAYVADTEACWSWDLPQDVSTWIRRWDNEKPVEPFVFEVDSFVLCQCPGQYFPGVRVLPGQEAA